MSTSCAGEKAEKNTKTHEIVATSHYDECQAKSSQSTLEPYVEGGLLSLSCGEVHVQTNWSCGQEKRKSNGQKLLALQGWHHCNDVFRTSRVYILWIYPGIYSGMTKITRFPGFGTRVHPRVYTWVPPRVYTRVPLEYIPGYHSEYVPVYPPEYTPGYPPECTPY